MQLSSHSRADFFETSSNFGVTSDGLWSGGAPTKQSEVTSSLLSTVTERSARMAREVVRVSTDTQSSLTLRVQCSARMAREVVGVRGF